MKFVYSFFLLIGLFSQLNAQSNLQWKAWGWSDRIRDIHVDDDYAWLATDYGVVRLDKSDLSPTHYNTINTNNGLMNHMVNNVTQNQSGNLLLGINCGGYQIFDGDTTWQRFTTAQGVPNICIDDIVVDANNNYWMATNGGGLMRFDGNTWTSYGKSSGLGTVWVNKLFLKGNVLWCATNSNGVVSFDGTNWTVYNTSNSGIPGNDISDVLVLDNGDIWVAGSTSGLAKFDGSNWTVYNTGSGPFTSNQINCLTHDGSRLYVGAPDGLYVYNGTKWELHYGPEMQTDMSAVISLAYDGVKNKMYIGTYDNLSILDIGSGNFKGFGISNSSFSDNEIKNMAISPDNEVYFTDGSSQIKTFKNGQWSLISNNMYNNPMPKTMIAENGSRLWLGTGSGLGHFNGTDWSFITNPNLTFNVVNCMDKDATGNIWIGYAISEGLHKFDGTNFTESYNTSNSSIPGNDPTRLKTDANGNVWFAIFAKGLIRFDGSNFTEWNTSNSQIPSNYVHDIDFDKEGKLYVGTDGGLAVFDTTSGAWTVYNMTNAQFPVNFVYHVKVVSKGYVWVAFGGSKGIGLLKDSAWTFYTAENNGLPTNIIDDIKLAPDGTVYFDTYADGVFAVLDDSIVAGSSMHPKWLESHLQLYPNPNSGNFIVHSQESSGPFQLEITDLLGRKIESHAVRMNEDEIQVQIRAAVPTGNYFVKLITQRGIQTQMFFIQ